MKLFHSPASPYVRKVMVIAHETGQEIETLPSAVSPVKPDAAVSAVNPLGKVPSAVLDDGSALYDSRVICRWLDETHDGPKLYPAGVMLWDALRREALADGLLDAALLARYETVMRPEALRWDEWTAGQMAKINAALDQMEKESAFFAGVDAGQIAIACALGYLDFRFPDHGWREGRGALAAWYEEFAQRNSMVATKPA